MEKEVSSVKRIQDMDQDVLRAVYALNMCTVSVSQIIDYNDVYILEQEYEAILNNLNLEKMPKADALKNILVELLNTITFFRIQEIRKEEIEKKYQNRVKNAIWSAVPNLSVIVAGGPAAILFSVATQVGIGYMNYRKERKNALTEKEKEELELRITAIEQFNALRRELFTTAWELAEEYNFDDRLRLTEKQIKQYNKILMDQDELRKYVRLDAIKNKFEAFPPFWYFFGHTACYIAEDRTLPLEEHERQYYRNRAKEHFNHYEELNKFNILREDQMTSAFALEYIDLLLLEDNPDYDKINKLIAIADDMSGNAFDIKQLCAIAYLKIMNNMPDAREKVANILLQLINEEYNTITNAKLLSRLYVSQYIEGDNYARTKYKTLIMRVGEQNLDKLFPMPDDRKELGLQAKYLKKQKEILVKNYKEVIKILSDRYSILINSVIYVPDKENYSKEYYDDVNIFNRIKDMEYVFNNNNSKSQYIREIVNIGFRFKYIDILNEAIDVFKELIVYSDLNCTLFNSNIKEKLGEKRKMLEDIQTKMGHGTFSIDDYEMLQKSFTFKALIGTMLDDLVRNMENAINIIESDGKIENIECRLMEFCQKYNSLLHDNNIEPKQEKVKRFLDYDVLGENGVDEKNRLRKLKSMMDAVEKLSSDLIVENTNDIRLFNYSNMETYFENEKKSFVKKYNENVLLIINDSAKKGKDLIITDKDIILFENNKELCRCSYDSVKYTQTYKEGDVLSLKDGTYSSKNIRIDKLYALIKKLKDIKDEYGKEDVIELNELAREAIFLSKRFW